MATTEAAAAQSEVISWWGEDKKTGLAKAMILNAEDKKKSFYHSNEIRMFFKGQLADGKKGGLLFRISQQLPPYNYGGQTKPTVAELPLDVVKAADSFVINYHQHAEIWKDTGNLHEQGKAGTGKGDFLISYAPMLHARALMQIPGTNNFFVDISQTGKGEIWTHGKFYALDSKGNIIADRIVGYIRATDCRRVEIGNAQLVTAPGRSTY